MAFFGEEADLRVKTQCGADTLPTFATGLTNDLQLVRVMCWSRVCVRAVWSIVCGDLAICHVTVSFVSAGTGSGEWELDSPCGLCFAIACGPRVGGLDSG